MALCQCSLSNFTLLSISFHILIGRKCNIWLCMWSSVWTHCVEMGYWKLNTGSCFGKGMMTITLLYYSSCIINNLVGLYNSVYVFQKFMQFSLFHYSIFLFYITSNLHRLNNLTFYLKSRWHLEHTMCSSSPQTHKNVIIWHSSVFTDYSYSVIFFLSCFFPLLI